MEAVYNLIITNVYLYVCIIMILLILTTILLIVATNQKNRRKIKKDFIEAEKVEVELEKKDETPVSNELENILKKMQDDMNVQPEDVVKKFEEEQEEKAIISYQELVNNVKSGKIEVIDDEENNVDFVKSLGEDIVDEPVMAIAEDETKPEVTPDMVKEAILNISQDSIKEEPKQFKQSEFISPIYGRMENNVEYPTVKKMDTTSASLDIMNTKDYNELTEQIKRQEEFLNALKEFRNNL